DDIPARLSTYAEAVKTGDDDRSVFVTVKPGVRFKTFTSGASVVVDLLPPAPSAKATADKATAAPEAAMRVPVRAGAHATFNRFVFDWPASVTYTVAREGDAAVNGF